MTSYLTGSPDESMMTAEHLYLVSRVRKVRMKGSSSAALFGISLVCVVLLCASHLWGSLGLLSASIGLFLVLVLTATRERVLPLLLFFMPFASVLKAVPDQTSFLTVASELVFVLLAVHPDPKRRTALPSPMLVVLVCVLGAYTALVKVIIGEGVSPSYISFLLLLTFLPGYLRAVRGSIDFAEVAKFFAGGACVAGLMAIFLQYSPGLVPFINVTINPLDGLTRFSGFYGDANLYGAHMLAAIVGLGVVFVSEGFSARWVLVFVALIYLGATSVSKSFLIFLALVLILLVWSTGLRRSTVVGCLAVAGLGLTAWVSLSWGPLSAVVNMYLGRFVAVTDLQTLTTSRSSIIDEYFNYFSRNVSALLFGQGFSDVTPFGRAAHNTIVQAIYLLGLVGTPLLVLWGWWTLKRRDAPQDCLPGSRAGVSVAALAVGCFGPWLSLDELLFESSFLIWAFFVCAVFSLRKGARTPRDDVIRFVMHPRERRGEARQGTGPSSGLDCAAVEDCT